MKIKLKRFSLSVRTPTRTTKGLVGYDLLSTEKIDLRPHSANTISTVVGFKK